MSITTRRPTLRFPGVWPFISPSHSAKYPQRITKARRMSAAATQAPNRLDPPANAKTSAAPVNSSTSRIMSTIAAAKRDPTPASSSSSTTFSGVSIAIRRDNAWGETRGACIVMA